MKPLIVLVVAFLMSLAIIRIVKGKYDVALAARLGMSMMLVFTAIGHFAFAKGMAAMVPDFIPFKKEMVFFTGIVEILAAIGLHIPQLRVPVAWLLIMFFVLVLPANIKASLEQINYQTGTHDGPGLAYLWFRVPLQILFVVWVYLSSIKV